MRSFVSLVCFSVILFAAASSSAQTTRRERTPPPPRSERAAAAPTGTELKGTLADGVYTNGYFGFSLRVPEDYVILNSAEIEVYTAAGADALKGGDAKGGRALDEAVGRTRHLLAVAMLPPGSPGNAALGISIAKQPAGATARMVAAESVRVLTIGGKSRLKANLGERKFGGRAFTGVELETQLADQMLVQRFYIAIVRGYALNIGLTYTTPETLAAFDGMLDSVSWQAK